MNRIEAQPRRQSVEAQKAIRERGDGALEARKPVALIQARDGVPTVIPSAGRERSTLILRLLKGIKKTWTLEVG